MFHKIVNCFLFLTLLCSPALISAQCTEATLIKDINDGPNSSRELFNTTFGSGSGSEFVEINGRLFFNADDGIHGNELWVTDGTNMGTALFLDISSGAKGSFPQNLTKFEGKLYFGAGGDLWLSDGTIGGTSSVSSVSNPGGFTEAGGKLFFRANGSELWMTDGTAMGTILVSSLSSSISNLTEVAGKLFFAVGGELWMSDGSAAGTTLVKVVTTNSIIEHLTEFEGKVYFSILALPGRGLWVSDGTEMGTTIMKEDLLFDAPNGVSDIKFTEFDSRLFFVAFDGTTGDRELWATDGTTNGTIKIKDFNSGPLGSTLTNLTKFDGQLFFRANDGTNGFQLWVTDGTEGGTTLFKDIDPVAILSSEKSLGAEHVGRLFFPASDGTNGTELWATDGTAQGTVLISDINTVAGESSSPFSLTEFSGQLIFTADGGTSGRELWTLECEDPNAIPTMGQWALWILMLSLSSMAIVTIYNRKRQTI